MCSFNFIKSHMKTGVLVNLLMLAFVAATARAGIINVDEFGNGTFQATAGGPAQPFPTLGNIVDPLDPFNGLLPLGYDLTPLISPPGLTPGDVNLFELGTNGTVIQSDVVRFVAPNNWMVIYSDRADPGEVPIPLADVGFSTTGVVQPNAVSIFETGPETGPNGLFNYTPAPGQPGFAVDLFGQAVTYNFLSDGAVPEPTSLAVFALIASPFLLMRPRRR